MLFTYVRVNKSSEHRGNIMVIPKQKHGKNMITSAKTSRKKECKQRYKQILGKIHQVNQCHPFNCALNLSIQINRWRERVSEWVSECVSEWVSERERERERSVLDCEFKTRLFCRQVVLNRWKGTVWIQLKSDLRLNINNNQVTLNSIHMSLNKPVIGCTKSFSCCLLGVYKFTMYSVHLVLACTAV